MHRPVSTSKKKRELEPESSQSPRIGKSTPSSKKKGSLRTSTDKVKESLSKSIVAVKKLVTPAEQAKLVLGTFSETYDHVEPICVKALTAFAKLLEQFKDYHPDQYLPILFGLKLCFYGGHIPATIAAAEAFRLAGSDKLMSSVRAMEQEFQNAFNRIKEDSLVDADGNGICDVYEMKPSERLFRRMSLVFESCDPNKAGAAIEGLITGMGAVIAALRLKFAESAAIGSVIGDRFTAVTSQFVEPQLKLAIQSKYHHWIQLIIKYTCQTLGAGAAFFLHRVMSTFYGGIKGSQILTHAILNCINEDAKKGKLKMKEVDENSPTVVAGTLVVAWAGILYQLTRRSDSPPFPVNIMMKPTFFLEWVLVSLIKGVPYTTGLPLDVTSTPGKVKGAKGTSKVVKAKVK
mmetsp:Transcript_17699/g.21229  ORF Transcript_17699/g.21229 Transcript_17699/m.21229 type:complete len:404 (+) Transcript_17699:186-1397(+)|eukprot:CAMPEP_0197854750 /NCGR_PEP_ID=MMETSP1438-20131217/25269_1 /TAXON_ID=1461541 /ORGANISM="Pterosperma sp., Strain CCMP1384" /LENGTH=403 /DNA_ID=CAMNT_0043469609 /DNA_START=174 /DNA_END=1385 /DNA_ORIENTATION=+